MDWEVRGPRSIGLDMKCCEEFIGFFTRCIMARQSLLFGSGLALLPARLIITAELYV